MSPFEPLGEQARWRIVYELLARLQVGQVLTYETMGEALGLHPVDERMTIQLAMRRAARELETADKHAVDVVRGVGYRIVEPTEHIGLARRHQRKAGRALARGESKVVNIDFNALDPETRKVVEVVAAAFAMQRDFNRRMDVRQKHLEKAVQAVEQRTDAHVEQTDSDISELRARLERLESKRTSGSS